MTLKIGCTGGIACGKSEATARFIHQGIPCLDTDKVAHEIMMPGTQVYDSVVARFGEDIVSADGTLHRPSLGNIVFNDPEALRDLNQLVHPHVRKRWLSWLEARKEPVAIVVIPLLVESGYQNEFDDILCISSTEKRMVERLKDRGFSRSEAMQRIQSQLPLENKEKEATWVLTNNGTLEQFTQKVDEWITSVIPTENT